ncbi:MAG: flavoprotein [Pseudonocardiaceae bacterium]
MPGGDVGAWVHGYWARAAQDAGWTVVVTLTPTAGRWLQESGMFAQIEEASGFPVRVDPRSPTEHSPSPPVDCYLVAPASANTVVKLVLGIADNQALTQVNEAMGIRDLPVVVFPRVNAAHARRPLWNSHIDTLHRAGVHLVYGDDVWPRHEPRSASERELPWSTVIDAVNAAVPIAR